MTQVRVAGTDVRLDAAPDQTVLDAAEAAGWSIPYSCRKGVCSTLLLPKTLSMLVGADAWVRAMLRVMAVRGARAAEERYGMVIDRAAATGLSRHDERVRAAAAAADE
jgi:2Fe-2S iron-sulfur cluster binding domain